MGSSNLLFRFWNSFRGQPNEQREQKPNLFGLCRVESEGEEVNRTSSERRSQTCLDYAESQARKAKSNCKVERERSELRD